MPERNANPRPNRDRSERAPKRKGGWQDSQGAHRVRPADREPREYKPYAGELDRKPENDARGGKPAYQGDRDRKPSGERRESAGSRGSSGRGPRSGDKFARPFAGKPAGRTTGKPTGKPSDRPAGKPSDRPTGKPSDRPAGKSAGKPVRKPAANNEKRFDVSPARKAALEVGRMLRERDAFAQDLIATHIDASRMSREDRAFATRLVLGVVSARGTLDDIINRSLRSPDDVKDNVRDALRIGVYEMYFLDKSPHAAVDQCVELVRTFESKACGLANAALRKASTLKADFPFGDPKTDLEAFARSYAFPVWLTRRLVADLGLEAARDFMEASNEPAPLFAAINAARATDDEVCAELEAAHGDPEPVEVDGRTVPGCWRLSSGRVLLDGRVSRLINQGKLFVSDAASQEVARLVLPESAPASFLEIGAGRGTKTLLLQSDAVRAWGAQMPGYVALDNHSFKTQLLADRAAAYGVQVDETLTGDATDLDAVLSKRLFDVVFIDAPCSGLGTLRRHPEIRWRLDEETIGQTAETNLAMLKSAAAHVAPGGTLTYATCTVTHAENNGVVMAFLESAEGADFSLVPLAGKGCFATRLVSGGPDAHFAVKMVRAS